MHRSTATAAGLGRAEVDALLGSICAVHLRGERVRRQPNLPQGSLDGQEQ